jgi:hypothetical protein
MRAGLDSKKGIPKMLHARAYRRYAEETLRVVKVYTIPFDYSWNLTHKLFYRRYPTEREKQNSPVPRTRHLTSSSGALSIQPRLHIDAISAAMISSQRLNRNRAGRILFGLWHVERPVP